MTKRTADVAGQPAAAPAERVVARLHPHARRLFWSVVLLLIVCGATGYFAGNFPEPWQNVALLVGVGLIVFFGCFLPFLFWLTTRYTITTRRVILRRGFFVRVRQEVLHSRGYQVTVRTGWLQTLSRSGDVLIDTGQGRPIVLADVPSVSLVQQTLHDLIEEAQANAQTQAQSQGPGEATDASGSGQVPS